MKLFLVSGLLSLVLVQLSRGAPLGPPTQKDWATTGLKLKNYEEDIIPRCFESAPSFLGCVDGLNVVAASGEKPYFYATEDEIKSEIFVGALIEKGTSGLNRYEIKKVDEYPGTEVQKLAAKKAAREVHNQSLLRLYASQLFSEKRFNFLEQLKNARANLNEAKFTLLEPEFVGSLYNHYFHAVFDPHSDIVPHIYMQNLIQHPTETFSGVGLNFDLVDGVPTVVSLIEDSPAWKVGLRRGDQMLSIDGYDTGKFSRQEVRDCILGPEDTGFKIQVKRGNEVLNFNLTRAKIVDDSISSHPVNHLGVTYGYIGVRDFMDGELPKKVKRAIVDLEAQGAEGFILDLRGNGGGLLKNAVDIGGYFVGKKLITMQKFLNLPEKDAYYPHVSEIIQITQKPLVTLLDSGSASASELLAGALQDYGRSWVVGQRSYGKGSVQQSYEFAPHEPSSNEQLLKPFVSSSYQILDKVYMKQTIARFYQPSGRTNQMVGISPHFQVGRSAQSNEEVEFIPREEDNFSNALTGLGKPWVQPNKKAVRLVDQCRKKGKEAESAAARLDPILPNGADFQLFSAEEVLKCAASAEAVEHSTASKWAQF